MDADGRRETFQQPLDVYAQMLFEQKSDDIVYINV